MKTSQTCSYKHIFLLRPCRKSTSVNCLTVVSQSHASGLYKVFHPGAGRAKRCSVHQRGGGVGPGGAGTLAGYQSALHEGAGKRGGHSTLAGEQRDELRLQRLHLQDHLLQEEAASDSRSVAKAAHDVKPVIGLLNCTYYSSTSNKIRQSSGPAGVTLLTSNHYFLKLCKQICTHICVISLHEGVICAWSKKRDKHGHFSFATNIKLIETD